MFNGCKSVFSGKIEFDVHGNINCKIAFGDTYHGLGSVTSGFGREEESASFKILGTGENKFKVKGTFFKFNSLEGIGSVAVIGKKNFAFAKLAGNSSGCNDFIAVEKLHYKVVLFSGRSYFKAEGKVGGVNVVGKIAVKVVGGSGFSGDFNVYFIDKVLFVDDGVVGVEVVFGRSGALIGNKIVIYFHNKRDVFFGTFKGISAVGVCFINADVSSVIGEVTVSPDCILGRGYCYTFGNSCKFLFGEKTGIFKSFFKSGEVSGFGIFAPITDFGDFKDFLGFLFSVITRVKKVLKFIAAVYLSINKLVNAVCGNKVCVFVGKVKELNAGPDCGAAAFDRG